MSLVLDSCITLGGVYGAETAEPGSQIFDLLSRSGAWVPQLWRLEVANVLEMGVRCKHRGSDFRNAIVADLAQLPFQVDSETDKQAWGATLRLAERHQLTLYDAASLELALRRNLPLTTLDKDLRRTANAERVRRLGS